MTKPSGNPRGRPKKSDIVERKESRGVGRPKGTQAIINEYRERMLNSPKSAKVLEAIFGVALDTEHKHWAAAAKLITDRIVPMSVFDPSAQKNGTGGVPQISINISTLGQPTVDTVEEFTDVDIKEYDDTE